MKYKMIVLDMDDTLLDDNHIISLRNKNAIMKAQEMGVYVVLASGRPTPAMTRYALDLKMDFHNSYMLSYNGAVISDLKNDEIVFQQTLTKAQIHNLYDYSVSKKVHIITYFNNEIISETNSEFIEIEKSITGLKHNKVIDFKEVIKGDVVKCILLEEPAYLKTIEFDLKLVMPNLSVTMSKPYFLEVAQNGIDKGSSLAFLAQKLNIQQDEIIAIGNAGNDLSMIEYAGLGVWVDNVNPELRHLSNIITSSNNDDGVAEVIEKYVLK